MGNSKDDRNKNPYIGTLTLTVVCIIVTITISLVVMRFYRRGLMEETEKETYDRYYVMITDDTKASIWDSIYKGAYEHALEQNVYVDRLGDNLLAKYRREDLMEIAIASDVDGIIVAADENDTLTDLINEASVQGIPVVTLYGDNPHSNRCSFVGVASYNLGREYGRQALEIIRTKLIGEKEYVSEDMNYTTDIGSANRPIRVAVLVDAYAQDLDQNILCSGIQETLENELMGDTTVDFSLIAVDDTNAFSVEESIRDIFMEKSIPDIMICLNELSTTCVYQAVVDYNKVGQVNILGYYDSETIINAIARKVIYATISIDTVQMGNFCIDALQEYNDLGYTSQYFTADITLIGQDDVEEYLEKEEQSDEGF